MNPAHPIGARRWAVLFDGRYNSAVMTDRPPTLYEVEVCDVGPTHEFVQVRYLDTRVVSYLRVDILGLTPHDALYLQVTALRLSTGEKVMAASSWYAHLFPHDPHCPALDDAMEVSE